MANVQRALAGKRVYRNSSYAPTRGTNNPSGYIKREMYKRNGVQRAQKIQPQGKIQPAVKQTPGQHGVSAVGNDGRSDTRSGLAARALRPPIRPIRNQGIMAGAAASLKKNIFKGGGAGKPGGNKPVGTFLQRPPFVTPQYQPIQINSNGTLDLPFSYTASQNALEQQQAANQKLQDLQSQSQEQAASYLQSMRNAGQQYEQNKRATLNTNAARGTAFSSQYGTQVAQNATDYNNQTNDLNSQKTLFDNNIVAQRNQVAAGLNDFLRQQALERGMQLQGQTHMPYGETGKPMVGSLGYDTSKAMVATKKPSKKAKTVKKVRR